MSKKPNKPASRTKSETIISLLQRNNGASIAELAKATDWQHHSLYGFISGTLRKKRGFAVASIKDGAKRVRYKIEGEAQ